MTVDALIVSLSMTFLLWAFAFVYWLNRREEAVHGWVAAWMGASCLFLAARLLQMLNGSAAAAPLLGRAMLTGSLLTTWSTFHFASAYLGRRTPWRELVITGLVLGTPLVMLWSSELVLTHTVITRVLWGRDAFLGVVNGRLYLAFPATSLAVGAVGIARLARGWVARRREGTLVFTGYMAGAMVLAADVFFTVRGAGFVPRFSDFAGLPLAFAFAFSQVTRYARLYGELGVRVAERTRELADANERLREEYAHREALHDRLASAQRMEALGRLAGGVAHDFNNLLTVILGNATLLRAELPASTGGESLGEIEHAAMSAAELTRQLLVFGRRQAMERRIVDLRGIVERLRTLLTRLIGEDIRIDVSLSTAPANALVDATQIEQIVVNLAVNARDAMPHGGTLGIAVDVVVLDEATAPIGITPGTCARVTVSDTGTGIAPEVRERVFDPFFTTKPVGKGTGLGLSIVYGAVQQNQGAISFESEVGRGTTFRLDFPLATEGESVEGERDTSLPRGTERIWLVEDQPLVRSFVEAALSKLGYAVRSFASGEQLLESIGAIEAADLLVTDLVLPNIDGRMLAERVRAARPGIGVLLASGYSEEVISRRGKLPEDMTLMTKPFTVDVLAKTVRAVLDQRRSGSRVGTIAGNGPPPVVSI